MTKHTPGPWYCVEACTPRRAAFNVNPKGGYCLTTVSGPRSNTSTVYANARLMAAAPELLEALTIIANVSIGQTPPRMLIEEMRDIARAAIDKVKGEE